MKYLNKYNDLPSYISAKQGDFAYPHVSLIAETGGVMYDPEESDVDYSREYLTITALEDGCCVYFVNGDFEGEEPTCSTIYFSTDKSTWTATQSKVPTVEEGEEVENNEENEEEYEENDTPSITITMGSPFITLNRGEKVYLKGNNTAYADMEGSIESICCMPSSNNDVITTLLLEEPDPSEFSQPLYDVSGNIMSMLYGDNFIGQTTLREENAFCFGGFFMLLFNGGEGAFNPYLHSCEHLILPATTLSLYCYIMMFGYCTGLTIAPELPATTLSEYCYGEMFMYCVNLVQAPVLPATTLTEYCYMEMFASCMSLNRIECLATDISAESCTMYWVAEVAETGTFVKNPEMTSWPVDDPQFSGIPIGWTVEDAGVPAIKFTAVQANSTLGLAKLAENQTLQYSTDDGETWNTFAINTLVNLEHIDDYIYVKGTLSDDNSTDDYTNFTVSGNVSVGGNINTLWGGQLYDYCGYSLFKNCTAVSDISELKLPASILTKGCYSRMFKSCTGLTETIPSLSATTLATDCYKEMFAGCSNLEEAPELQAITLAQGCYHGMFAECTSLEEAPELYAGVLVQSCYQNMFDGCSSLNYIKCHATDISATDCTTSWVKNVANSGTFYKYAKTNFVVNSVNGIPNGWTVSIMPIPAIKFTANEANSTIGLASQGAYHSLEYSEDGGDTWEEMTTETEITLENIEDSVYIRGILRQFDQQEHTFTQFSITGDVSLSGNANSLWNYLNMNNAVIMGCGYNLFKDCTGISDAHLLTLPTTNLTGKMACYSSMFEGCTSLISIPQLPATTLAEVCYSGMFSGCTSLTSTTQLPATVLARSCYANMFSYCTSLTTSPQLPATTLANSCYNEMFKSCTSLTTAPQISATTLAESCYSGMFRECTSLTTAPQLPATTLDRYCYSLMFYGCSSLTTAPQLSATNLEYSCYSQMFYGCASLTTVPHITAITVMDYSCNGMFFGCENLTAAPISLLATSLGQFCYAEMFRGCTSLIAAPELPATTLAYSCYQYMFVDCTSLTQAPALPATTLAEWCYSSMFAGCTRLVASPELLASQLVEGCYFSMFSNCSNLKEVICFATSIDPENNSTTNWLTNVSSTGDFYKNMNMLDWETGDSGIPEGWNVSDFVPSSIKFKANQANSTIGLSNLGSNQFLEYSLDGDIWTSFSTNDTIILNNIDDYVYIRGELSSNNSQSDYTQFTMSGGISIIGNINYLWNEDKNADLKDYCGYRLFANCSALVTAPQLPTKVMSNYCYAEMFSGCTGITIAPELPATTLATGCYANMFSGCTNITSSPVLSSASLSPYCYFEMFSGCTSLNEISCFATNLTAENCTNGWVTNVAASGTFTRDVTANSWTSGDSGIPSGWEVIENINAIKFKAKQANSTIGLAYLESTKVTVEYSSNGINWNPMSDSITINLSNINDVVYLRGIAEEGDYEDKYMQFDITGSVSISGNVNYLWNYLNPDAIDQNYYNYNIELFKDCTGLTDASRLTVSNVKGFNSCRNMFEGCTSLLSAPKLPATTSLGSWCYRDMFSGCTSLTTAPQLPATTLSSYCYANMFENCTSLVNAPVLPATTLREGCYNGMFRYCTSLTTAPQLPATTLTDICYDGMFQGCSSLTTPPLLPATTLARGCYNSMFYGCSEMTTAPQLPATNLDERCYSDMFQYCSSITNAPALPATTLAKECYLSMFRQCSSLTTAPQLPATTLAMSCYSSMFSGCASLTTAPQLPATTLAESCYSSMFRECTSLTTAPQLPARNLDERCYSDMFNGCTNLITAPQLPATTLTKDCYSYMFSGCTSLTTAPQLPATTLAESCYEMMFQSCNSLTVSPVLPALTLAKRSYCGMFFGCNSLKQVVCLATNILAESCVDNFLYGVSTNSGKFLKNVNMNNWPLFNQGEYPEIGVPYFWKIEDYEPEETIKFVANQANSTIGLSRLGSHQTISYTTDQGISWNSLTTANTITLNNIGDTVFIKGNLSANNTQNDYTQFTMSGSIRISGKLNYLWNSNLASSLKSYCGFNLFSNCTALTSSPDLLSTALSDYCYANMFYGCTNLTSAPDLNASTLTQGCYSNMFNGCTSLSRIECRATNISATDCTLSWMNNVASNGVFYRDRHMQDWTNGVNGIPTNWTTKELEIPAIKFTAVDTSNTIGLSKLSTYQTLEYSNDGENWEPMLISTTINLPNVGDYVYVRGILSEDNNYNNYTTFSVTGLGVSVSGNINSLWNYNYLKEELKEFCGYYLFSNASGLSDISGLELPATTLAVSCYDSMFRGCTSLTTSPSILPATTLADKCYESMFRDCHQLVAAPQLPATTLVGSCYNCMFIACWELEHAPQLPATTLAPACYYAMFRECRFTLPPQLPATTLANSCYSYMFSGCINLTESPVLPAEELVNYCYAEMFESCTYLNKITMLATDVSVSSGLSNWVNGVSNSGTFIKAASMTTLPTGSSGVPSGWTVEDYVE